MKSLGSIPSMSTMHKTYYDTDYKMNNREKVLHPKGDKHSWCEHCDRDLVSEGAKCKTCGYTAGYPRKRFKV